MALTQLDDTTALIVIDLQNGIAAMPLAHGIGGVIERCRFLADAFRARGLPVVLVNVAGRAPGRARLVPKLPDPLPAAWTELLPEMGRHPDDILVTKRSWGAFTGTGLEERLRGLGVTQVVVAGVATSIGVGTTARQAYELGFNVALATDAMTDPVAEMHELTIAHIFPRLGETATAREIAALLGTKGA